MITSDLYIGVMSGTSLDGVDVVLCKIDSTQCILVSSLEYSIPLTLKKDILCMINNDITLKYIGKVDHLLGLLFADAILAFCEQENISKHSISAIGLHGQTVWHEPSSAYPTTMQLGDPNIVVAKTGIAVVSDFRRADVALGGEGAPFAPAFHKFIFDRSREKLAVVNIGGMANITILDTKIVGYDTGCGNVLLDMWIDINKGLPYDRDGLWAKDGSVDKTLLQEMLKDSYFLKPYPKSTGREKFNKIWLDNILKNSSSTPKVVQRTLLELTAVTICDELKKFDINRVILCGGGAKNLLLVERIREILLDVKIDIAKHSDWLESMAFAWLAYKRVKREKVELKDVTGACRDSILGAYYE